MSISALVLALALCCQVRVGFNISMNVGIVVILSIVAVTYAAEADLHDLCFMTMIFLSANRCQSCILMRVRPLPSSQCLVLASCEHKCGVAHG